MRSFLKNESRHLTLGASLLMFVCSVIAQEKDDGTGQYNATSLCDKKDNIYLSCKTKKSKIISFCGEGDMETPSAIYYRFGNHNRIEMQYPENKSLKSISQFGYWQHSRAGMSAIWVSFQNHSYNYEIVSYYESLLDGVETIFSGVNVNGPNTMRHERATVDIECESEIINKLAAVRWFMPCKGEKDSYDCFPDNLYMKK